MHKALDIKLKDDDLTVTMTVVKEVLEKQKELTYPGLPDVLAALKELKVVYGVDNDKILDNLKFKDTPVVIAKGRPMAPTVNDTVAYTFEDMRHKKITPTILADDKANFYDFVHFKLVKENELLMFIRKGRQGDNGMSVLGIEIRPDKYIEMTTDSLKKFVGPNTQLSSQGIVATTAGIPVIDATGKVSVNETYVVSGDVDFNTGSIDYDGPVIIKGMITNNFTVKTPKDVIVEGIVDGGIIESEGMVSLLGGINKGRVKCKNNLVAKYIYASDINCETTVIVDEAILNSKIVAKTVIAKGEPASAKSGQVSGGKIVANNFIWAKTLGSPSTNPTEVTIKSFIDRAPLEALNAEHSRYQGDLEKIFRTIKLMEELKKKTPNLPPDFQIKQVKLLKTKIALENKLKTIKSQLQLVERDIEKEDKECVRKAYVTVAFHPKVLVEIMGKKALSKMDYGPTIIHVSEEDGAIKIEPATGKMELPKEYEDN